MERYHCIKCSYETTQREHCLCLCVCEGQDTELVERYHCIKCSYETTQREHFRRHVDAVHSNLRPFLCDVCGQRFKRHDALLHHTQVLHHTQNEIHDDQSETRSNTHRCSVCDRTFSSKVCWSSFSLINKALLT